MDMPLTSCESSIDEELIGRRSQLAIVVIGRNEGQRLERCLDSLRVPPQNVVYVDSGSTDQSVLAARKRKMHVVELNQARGFSAARARNAGVTKLEKLGVEADYIQFVDGDCEIAEGWMQSAMQFLDSHPEYAAVCGRRRERFPDASIYNRLCDIEWDTPVGDALSCGGDSLIRRDAFCAVGGFNNSVIAGEEPELCVRLRQAGWKIFRLDAEMSLHDAAMTRFGQWWARARRSGYAYAQGAFLHGRAPERHWVRESLRCWFWAFVIPVATLGLTALFGWWGMLLPLLYPVLVAKTYLASLRRMPRFDASIWAVSCVASKFPELLGQVQFLVGRLAVGKPSYRPIEYKSGETKSERA